MDRTVSPITPPAPQPDQDPYNTTTPLASEIEHALNILFPNKIKIKTAWGEKTHRGLALSIERAMLEHAIDKTTTGGK